MGDHCAIHDEQIEAQLDLDQKDSKGDNVKKDIDWKFCSKEDV